MLQSIQHQVCKDCGKSLTCSLKPKEISQISSDLLSDFGDSLIIRKKYFCEITLREKLIQADFIMTRSFLYRLLTLIIHILRHGELLTDFIVKFAIIVVPILATCVIVIIYLSYISDHSYKKMDDISVVSDVHSVYDDYSNANDSKSAYKRKDVALIARHSISSISSEEGGGSNKTPISSRRSSVTPRILRSMDKTLRHHSTEGIYEHSISPN